MINPPALLRPQLDGIQAACGGRFWNVDIGASAEV